MIRVGVAARSSVVRAGLESVIRGSAALELAGSLDWALVSSAELDADVLLLDVAEALPDQLPGRVVLLLDTSDSALVNAALRSGIRGLLSREATVEEIESAIQAVHAGLVVMPGASLAGLLPELRTAVEELKEPLSDRELEVLNLIAEGHSNRLIAQSLAISEHTVKTHVASIFEKLGASNRTEAVSQAIRRGLVML